MKSKKFLNRSSSVFRFQMLRDVIGVGPAHLRLLRSAGSAGWRDRATAAPGDRAAPPALQRCWWRSPLSKTSFISAAELWTSNCAAAAADQTKRLYRCPALLHYSVKGRSIRSSRRAVKKGRRSRLVSEPRERRSPWRGGSPEEARERPETRIRGVRLRGRRRSGEARGGWDRGGWRRLVKCFFGVKCGKKQFVKTLTFDTESPISSSANTPIYQQTHFAFLHLGD